MRDGEKSYIGLPISKCIFGKKIYNDKLIDRYPNIIESNERYLQSDNVVKIYKTIFLPINITSLKA